MDVCAYQGWQKQGLATPFGKDARSALIHASKGAQIRRKSLLPFPLLTFLLTLPAARQSLQTLQLHPRRTLLRPLGRNTRTVPQPRL